MEESLSACSSSLKKSEQRLQDLGTPLSFSKESFPKSTAHLHPAHSDQWGAPLFSPQSENKSHDFLAKLESDVEQMARKKTEAWLSSVEARVQEMASLSSEHGAEESRRLNEKLTLRIEALEDESNSSSVAVDASLIEIRQQFHQVEKDVKTDVVNVNRRMLETCETVFDRMSTELEDLKSKVVRIFSASDETVDKLSLDLKTYKQSNDAKVEQLSQLLTSQEAWVDDQLKAVKNRDQAEDLEAKCSNLVEKHLTTSEWARNLQLQVQTVMDRLDLLETCWFNDKPKFRDYDEDQLVLPTGQPATSPLSMHNVGPDRQAQGSKLSYRLDSPDSMGNPQARL